MVAYGPNGAATDGAGAATDARVEALECRHREFCAELGLDADGVLGERLASLRALAADERATRKSLDWQAEVLGQGELLSSTLGVAYLKSQGLDIGWCDARDWLRAAEPSLEAAGVALREVRRDWDALVWPAATAGYTKVRKRIPEFLRASGL